MHKDTLSISLIVAKLFIYDTVTLKMAEAEMIDLTAYRLEAYFTHGDKDRLRAYLGEFILGDRREKIVDDANDAVVEYKKKFGYPAPNPLRIMFAPDAYPMEDLSIDVELDAIILEQPSNDN
jgi:hypothetical protein